jgi:hypothetical protein
MVQSNARIIIMIQSGGKIMSYQCRQMECVSAIIAGLFTKSATSLNSVLASTELS